MRTVVSRGRLWYERFANKGTAVAGLPPSVLAADVSLDGFPVRTIVVVPDPQARFERARAGEVGIDEGFGLAAAVNGTPKKSAILAIVDVPGQAFGVREEAVGLQRALAASADAYIRARRGGHPVLALVVGKAISGAFLAHGLQAGWIGALDDSAIEIHVMSEPAVARVTRMQREDLARIAREIPATARDIHTFARFGAIDRIFRIADFDEPSDAEVANVHEALVAVLRNPVLALRNPVDKLAVPAATQTRALARRVRDELAARWDE
ncbi:MAG TPA: biotin-independent malonate decarboxylase subunit gamma [Candidatus Baltobacteraceae bacterium]|nr:biotin-independent malonate decarboxylase subunit gamma [Candidatus Baltobacteraceae bacterium]